MSTDRSRPTAARFRTLLFATLGVLALLVGVGAAASMQQGPRLSSVQADPARAVDASGARVVLTANQALGKVDAAQVAVQPHADFTVDASGRSVGIRFTQPLDDDTRYRITVRDVHSVSGGPVAALTTELRTPAADLFFLRRDVAGTDVVYKSKLDGSEPVPVIEHEHIEDFRRAGSHLVVSVVHDGVGAIVVTGLDGKDQQTVPMPARGFVTRLQVSDRGDLIGYLFTDEKLTEGSGRVSQLNVVSLRDLAAKPIVVDVAGQPASMLDWRFVPDSSAMLFIDFKGDLMLRESDAGADPVSLGTAQAIDGITRGTYTAVVNRGKAAPVRVDLRTGKDSPLPVPEGDGTVDTVIPLAGTDLLWPFTKRDAAGMPLSRTYVVESGGKTRDLVTIPIADPVEQACASPSGKYIALNVTPAIVTNTYDQYLSPVPKRNEIRVLEASDGTEVARFDGFDLSWCPVGPW